MTNRLDLKWKLDGFVDEQHYYCSEAQIDPKNPPPPKAILGGMDRNHVDTNIEANKDYYVCIGSVKNGVKKISEIVKIGSYHNDSPRNICIVTGAEIASAPNVALKSVLQEAGHTVTVIASADLTLLQATSYDVLVASSPTASVAPSNIILSAFNAGIPVLCSNHSGTSIRPETWATKLGLLSQVTTLSVVSGNAIYRKADYLNIFLNSGVQTLPNSENPYTVNTYSTFSSGNVAQGAVVMAYRDATMQNPSIVLAEKNSLNLGGSPFTAKIGYIGAMFNYHTLVTQNTINEVVKWLTR